MIPNERDEDEEEDVTENNHVHLHVLDQENVQENQSFLRNHRGDRKILFVFCCVLIEFTHLRI